MRIGDLALQYDTSPAAWLQEEIRGFAIDVGSVVPRGYEAYARILHPARRRDGAAVGWADVAAATGRVAHPEMQWPAIAGEWPHQGGSGSVWEVDPEEGSLPLPIVATLLPILERATTTPDRGWFAVWDGWGGLALPGLDSGSAWLGYGRRRPGLLRRFAAARRRRARQAAWEALPRFSLPNRDYLLFAGPVSAAATSVVAGPGHQSPSLWWPDDRAWVVATEIDFMSTYVAAGEDVVDRVLGAPGIEAMATGVDHGVSYSADRHNPLPPRL